MRAPQRAGLGPGHPLFAEGRGPSPEEGPAQSPGREEASPDSCLSPHSTPPCQPGNLLNKNTFSETKEAPAGQLKDFGVSIPKLQTSFWPKI